LSGAAFSWFTSLEPNSVSTWAGLEERFHEYFYNGDTELKLTDLTSVRQKYTETVPEYNKRFRETRNECYSLTVREKDLADLAFMGLSSYLREKMEAWFRDGNRDKEKGNVGLVDENISSDEEAEVCVAEWVDTPKDKPITCAFLEQGPWRKEEMRFTFDVTKCDKLFNILLQNNVIRLKAGNTIPTPE
jgi:hypothetical protein